MRILLLTHSFNCLAQKFYAELKRRGHELSVEYDISDEVTESAVKKFKPDIILAPFLKREILESVWKETLTLIVHPGPPGDRGPSALDWAILNDEKKWGVTIIQASSVLDGGDIWAYRNFSKPKLSKGRVYREIIATAAFEAFLEALSHYEDFIKGNWSPTPSETFEVCNRPSIKQADRKINWQTDTRDSILLKINSADGSPGVLSKIDSLKLYLYEAALFPYPIEGSNGSALGICDFGVIVNTVTGPITIGHIKEKAIGDLPSFKKSASHFFPHLPHFSFSRVRVETRADSTWIFFNFYNGAMGVKECRDLHNAFKDAKKSSNKIIVLKSENDFFSNGIHLNEIEAAKVPADYAYENICAMNDLILEIILTTDKLTIALLEGNASAGGILLARANDLVIAKPDIILNPHYKNMGNLYGSEYWTYLFPKHLGEKETKAMMDKRLPMETQEALAIGLIDEINDSIETCRLSDFEIDSLIEQKKNKRETDESIKPLGKYREQEMIRMKENFYGFDPSFHVARYNFVRHVIKSKTPLHIAIHRKL